MRQIKVGMELRDVLLVELYLGVKEGTYGEGLIHTLVEDRTIDASLLEDMIIELRRELDDRLRTYDIPMGLLCDAKALESFVMDANKLLLMQEAAEKTGPGHLMSDSNRGIIYEHLREDESMYKSDLDALQFEPDLSKVRLRELEKHAEEDFIKDFNDEGADHKEIRAYYNRLLDAYNALLSE